mmetsp:Transcript_13128/g.43060  ORF Transcript_13128/g.43060 Transcript_13128/m.43060 type:complete len:277 (-) Transcript_13128:1273-2103(-)|eukprot:scaffold12965_cov241-Isochrysis_galbana.AAC.9
MVAAGAGSPRTAPHASRARAPLEEASSLNFGREGNLIAMGGVAGTSGPPAGAALLCTAAAGRGSFRMTGEVPEPAVNSPNWDGVKDASPMLEAAPTEEVNSPNASSSPSPQASHGPPAAANAASWRVCPAPFSDAHGRPASATPIEVCTASPQSTPRPSAPPSLPAVQAASSGSIAPVAEVAKSTAGAGAGFVRAPASPALAVPALAPAETPPQKRLVATCKPATPAPTTGMTAVAAAISGVGSIGKAANPLRAPPTVSRSMASTAPADVDSPAAR